jgi:hypothetical protein
MRRVQVARAALVVPGDWEELTDDGSLTFLHIASYNQHAIANSEMTEQIGSAFYPGISMLNHCCVPNVQYRTVRRRGRLHGQLVALVDIRLGEELTGDYPNNGHAVETVFNLKEDRLVRKLPLDVHYQIVLKLAAIHKFRCECDQCMRCVRCGREADTHCTRCGFTWCSSACKYRDPLHDGACRVMEKFRASHNVQARA